MLDTESFVTSAKNGLFDQLLNSIDQRFGEGSNYSEYQDDPVGFGEQVLGETYTDEVQTLMKSVRDNPVTVAISANATGKTHGAARVGVWFYKAFPDAIGFINGYGSARTFDLRDGRPMMSYDYYLGLRRPAEEAIADLKELMFLISVRVPSSSLPAGRR